MCVCTICGRNKRACGGCENFVDEDETIEQYEMDLANKADTLNIYIDEESIWDRWLRRFLKTS